MRFFLLGRNPELSRMELLSCLSPEREIYFKDNMLILDCKDINIQELGGTLMSGKVLFVGDEQTFSKWLDEHEVISDDKFSYFVIGEKQEEIKNKFKREKRKARQKKGRRELKLQNGKDVSLPNVDYYLFCVKREQVYFGLIEQIYNHQEVEKRDMQKPVRRQELAISPRLAKILINLSNPKQRLLDPFCGIGSILIEGLVKGYNVVGVDIDKQAINNAKKNLNWLASRYKTGRYELINADAKHIKLEEVDAIATEPHLGDLYKKKPSKKESSKIMENFEKMIIPILNNLKSQKKRNARIAMTVPYIGNKTIDVKKICQYTGLKLFGKQRWPIREARTGQYVGRGVVVFV
ncbi:MAG: TRM11 family SAM-dependent methyltransferase [Candidatus Nanoarchaeia archaeon]